MDSQKLKSLPAFAGLSSGQVERLAELFRAVMFPAGAVVFAAGDRADSLYIVESGDVIIRFHPYDGGALDIATINAGGAFGWSAALRRSYYTASAICRTDVTAFTIQAQLLHQTMADDPEFANALLEHASQTASSRFDGLGQQIIRILRPRTR
jgi:CRP-like cAMP-binding protein